MGGAILAFFTPLSQHTPLQREMPSNCGYIVLRNAEGFLGEQPCLGHLVPADPPPFTHKPLVSRVLDAQVRG